MADEPSDLNSLAAAPNAASRTPGDVPERVRRRYLLESRGGAGIDFYVDGTVTDASFRDQGRRLTTPRSDPNVIGDLVEIARHRGWTTVTVSGAKSFRRQSWLAGRTIGLDVRGYRPTQRDVQALDRRLDHRLAREAGAAGAAPPRSPSARDPTAGASAAEVRARMRIVEAVVRSRVRTEKGQDRILKSAKARLGAWLERGAHLRPLKVPEPEIVVARDVRRERRR